MWYLSYPLQSNEKKQTSSPNNLYSTLHKNRQKLQKKLDAYTIMFNIGKPLSCLEHDSYLSLYNKEEHRLICANCFNKSYKMDAIPVEKSLSKIQHDVKKMNMQLKDEVSTLKKIENILYEGFRKEQKSMKLYSKQLEKLKDKIISEVNDQYQQSLEVLHQTFNFEKVRHEQVITQLGILSNLIKQTLNFQKGGGAMDEKQKKFFQHQTRSLLLQHTRFKTLNWREQNHKDLLKQKGIQELNKLREIHQKARRQNTVSRSKSVMCSRIRY